MIRLKRKHYVLMILVLILFGGYIYLYFTDFRYADDRRDFRHYPIPPLTEKWTKTIEYKTLPNVKVRKCFGLSIDTSVLYKRMGERYYYDVYRQKYNYSRVADLTQEQFYEEAKEKPHFELKMYKDNVLIKQETIYFTQFESSSLLRDGEREFWARNIGGNFRWKQGTCYFFAENTDYKIELTNNTILPEYQEVESYLTIWPIDFAK